jgi:hypothetical protein
MTSHALISDIILGGGPRSGTTLLSKHPDPPFIPEPKVRMISHPAGDPGYRRAVRRCARLRPAGREDELLP